MKQPILILLVMILLTSFSVNAQMMRMDPKERAEELKEKLYLTDEQTEQVEQIYTNAENEIKSKVQGSGNREQMREAMETIMSNTDNEILKILDEVQQDKYNQMIEERRNEMKDMQRGFN